MSALSVETARVYRAAGRRYFSKSAAIKALARAMLRKHCYCEPGDHITPGSSCHYHHYANEETSVNLYNVIYPRLTRFIASRLKRSSRPSASSVGET